MMQLIHDGALSCGIDNNMRRMHTVHTLSVFYSTNLTVQACRSLRSLACSLVSMPTPRTDPHRSL